MYFVLVAMKVGICHGWTR